MDIEEDDCQENEYQHEVALIKKLDCKNIKCRQFLTRSFRKLDKLVNKKRNYTYTSIYVDLLNLTRLSLTPSSIMLKLSSPIPNKKCSKKDLTHLNPITISFSPIGGASKPKWSLMAILSSMIASTNSISKLNIKNLFSKMEILTSLSNQNPILKLYTQLTENIRC